MKLTHCHILIGFIVMFSACKKTEKLDGIKTTSIIERHLNNASFDKRSIFQQISAIGDADARKTAFSILSPNDRLQFWQEKFGYVLANSDYSNDKQVLIKNLIKALDITVFTEGDKKEIFQNYFIKNWVAKAEKKFSGLEIYNLVFNVQSMAEISLTNNAVNTQTTMGAEMACICAVGSLYTCGSMSIPFGVTFHTCTDKVACVQARSCGALFDLVCDGDTCGS